MYGNWIKRTEYNGAIPEFIVMRHIEYAEQADIDYKNLLLQGKVKSVHQTSYIALPNGPDIINRGQKKVFSLFTNLIRTDGKQQPVIFRMPVSRKAALNIYTMLTATLRKKFINLPLPR
ncbi:hypothetical protein SFC43_10665 [Bacteroides sp. CR5/BHMF/2]|nr:hypothetical protein [Bacteroides sp. CR5/BHMF/2]